MDTPTPVRRLTERCAGVVCVIALVALAGWAFNARFLAWQWKGSIPMPPAGALAFLALAGGLFVHARRPRHRLSRSLARAGASLAALLGLLVVAQFTLGFDTGVERALARTNEFLGQVPLGRASPLGAASFLVESVALLVLLDVNRWRLAGTLVAVLTSIITAINVVVVTGYAYGAPFLYGGTMIPVPFPSALALVLVGVGEVNLALPTVPALRDWRGESLRGRLLRAFLPGTVVLVLLEGWLDNLFRPSPTFSPALWNSLTALVACGLIIALTAWIARRTGDGLEEARNALHESEAWLQSLFRVAPIGIGIVRDRIMLEVNPRMRQLTGHTKEELVGQSTRILYPTHEDFDYVGSEIYGQIAAAGTAVGETRWQRKNGSIINVWLAGTAVTPTDRSEPMIFTALDITERKQAEEALKESEARFRSLFENMVEGFAYCRMLFEDGRADDFIYLAVNRAFETLTGLKDVIGRRASEVIRGLRELDPELLERYGRVVLTGEPERFEIYVAALNMWFSISAYCPEKDHFVTVFDVITERKLTEEVLRRNQVELRALYDNSPTMMCVLDGTRLVRYANRAFAEYVGRPAEEITYERACGVIGCVRAFDDPRGCGYGPNCETCSMRLAMVDALTTGLSHRSIEFRPTVLWHGEQQDRVFLASVAPIPVFGETQLLLCFEDITARERVADILRASQEQLRALAARLQAVREEERGGIAREIHDVLAQDLTRLKIDLVWLHGRLTNPARIRSTSALADRVFEMSQMADSTIHHVQRIATELRPAVLDSLGLSAAVEWHVRDFQERTGIGCHVDVPANWPLIDPGAATAAFRILQESLTNVLRHARATRVDVVLRQEEDYAVLKVQDNGCGAPANVLNGPTAIGIAGMRERATLIGGHVEITSLVGSGTTVEVRLPRSHSRHSPEDTT